MATHKITRSISSGSKVVSSTVTYTVQTETIMEEAVDTGATDLQFLLAIDISVMKTFIMVADQDMTVDTNSSGTPQETFNLLANKPVAWQEGEAAIFAGDVTSLFVTNSSGTNGTLKLMVGLDPPSI